jgi:isoamylase
MSVITAARHQVLTLPGRDFAVERGSALPLGATPRGDGVNFAIVSSRAREVVLVLFAPGGAEPLLELPLNPAFHRTGAIWHAFVRGVGPGVEYGYRAEGPLNAHDRFDRSSLLLDPYARAIVGLEHWGGPHAAPRGLVQADEPFDWGFDQPLRRPLSDTVIYEVHVRTFTQHPSSGVVAPGTYEGLVEKIPYLRALGVTAVELLPIAEFDETAVPNPVNPLTGAPLLNVWGYHPLSFFAPKTSYAVGKTAPTAIRAFKTLVREMHAAGIEVILDLVFNHTAEGGLDSPAASFRGLDNATYYLTDRDTGAYLDYSGCGNSVNCNHPVVRDLILECLRYWVTEMHVDGFRFDLASVLGRGRDGGVLQEPPLLEHIAADPVLADTKLIAEAWDAAGLYQVGSFPSWGRWAEWNGRYRDDMRRFLRGEAGCVGAVATRVAGSADLYRTPGRSAHHSINFITCHDGFTLRDLVSYDAKHNDGNGEDNRDGCNDNFSWNCGWEGDGAPPAVVELRARQMRNAFVLLLLSRGVPMILAGDERGRTQAGNNNAYCQDSESYWLDWSSGDDRLQQFVADLLAFRRAHAQFTEPGFLDPRDDGEPTVRWHGLEPDRPDWSEECRMVAFSLPAALDGKEIYVAANMHWQPATLHLPDPPRNGTWRLVVDTRIPDVEVSGGRAVPPVLTVAGRSCVVLQACVPEPLAGCGG